MRHFIPFASCFLGLIALMGFSQLSAQGLLSHWESRSPLPEARSNLAATAWSDGDTTWIYCFMGLDSSKACGSGIRRETWRYNTVSDRWDSLPPVPDTEGRIAASASTVGDKIYLIGGYKVFPNCNEYTSPNVDIFDPQTATWTSGAAVPFPTDDHVQVVWRDSLIICVSGWSQNTNLKRVQIYDPLNDSWAQSTLLPGPGLFGHCGGISGDTLIYLDGVRINLGSFQLINQVWKGVMQNGNPLTIQWTNLGSHPGDQVYRGAGFGFGNRILFSQGTDNAYNIDGIGYNNLPSIPQGRTFGYNLNTQAWEKYSSNPDSVMDVREAVQVGENQFYFIGGMDENQKVTDRVSVFVIDSVLLHRDLAQEPKNDFRAWWVGDELHLAFEREQAGPVEVRVMDLQGRVLFREKKSFLTNKTSIYSLDSLSDGLYFVWVQGENSGGCLRLLKAD